ncbi:MAG: YraN family protein [Muribaculaceae bacterium]|nr:YraN family protein [Muribaculaceae bacterium]
MAEHNLLGKWGEQVACEYLIVNGYTIIERDTREGFYELDIIAMKGNRIIFVEVKTRSNNYVDPLQSITPDKIKKLCRAADSYVKRHDIPHEVQFDIINIIGTPNTAYTIEHIPDAFRPPLRSWR